MEQELNEGSKNILELLLKPFLQKLLDLINKQEYSKIYCGIVVFVFLLIGLIWLFAFLRSQRLIKTELEKNNEERKSLQLQNLETLCQKKDQYLLEVQKLQKVTIQLIQAMKENNDVDAKKFVLQLRSSLFNKTFESFEKFIECYAIVYDKENYRFKDLFKFQYVNFLKTLVKYVNIINTPGVLQKTGLERYFIDTVVFESKYSYMKHHIAWYHFLLKIENLYYFKKFSKLFKKK